MQVTHTTREQALDLALRAIVIETMENPPIKPYSSSSYLPYPHLTAAINALNNSCDQDGSKPAPVVAQASVVVPAIGQAWPEQGGTYAGILRGENGQPDYHLIHTTIDHELTNIKWQAAIDSARKSINDFRDWSLPNRREARLLTINSPESFDKDGWYWTSEQSADDPDYAWMQDFYNGNQNYDHKSIEYRARAVRRVLIIQ